MWLCFFEWININEPSSSSTINNHNHNHIFGVFAQSMITTKTTTKIMIRSITQSNTETKTNIKQDMFNVKCDDLTQCSDMFRKATQSNDPQLSNIGIEEMCM